MITVGKLRELMYKYDNDSEVAILCSDSPYWETAAIKGVVAIDETDDDGTTTNMVNILID